MAAPKITEKRWEIKFEEELLDRWTQGDLHPFDPDSGKPVFVIDTPPPYPSGTWHIGAVAGYSLIDMIARSRRMLGYEVLFPFCLDKNGINIELTVERKHKKSLHEFDRQEFIDICREEIGKISEGILDLSHRMGMSADWEESYYETDTPEYRRITQAVFIDLWNKGLVYKGERPSFYCPACKTPIAEAEIEYVEKPSTMTTINFKVKDTGEDLPIATTRPELLCACKAVIVHPGDERFAHIQNKKAIVPIYGTEVNIYPHHYAKPEFGTGAAMMCSYGDQVDVQFFRELGLEAVKGIDTEGRMTEAAGKYAGMTTEEARRAITDDLNEQGLVVKEESMMHVSPMCSRSRTAVEFISMEEWYVKQIEFVPELKKLAEEMEYHPSDSKRYLDTWLDAITIDWPVSRRRYYHTEIPLWYCDGCGEVIVPPPGEYYQPWKDPPPLESCPKCGGKNFTGEDRVFDTWMDSSNSNLIVTKYMQDEGFFKDNFPCSLRPQGRDIVRTWLHYTHLKSFLVTGKKPFQHVFIHGMGLDENGRAMHRTLGNVIDPGPVIEKHGADAFRYWSAAGCAIGADFRISDERIGGAKKFLTKMWNVARFISSFPAGEKGDLSPADEWILAEANALIEACRESYEDFDFFVPSNRVREFLWNVFAPHYVEMVKGRAYEGQTGSLYALHEVLKVLLRLMAPITPFITARIWEEIYGGDVHREEMPSVREDWSSPLTELTQQLMDFNSEVWKLKKESGLSLREDISGIAVPDELKPFEDDLTRMHRLAG
ncbi:MAG: valine--tRNA ligase [Candidatus Thermoplasmatota archaeon]|nr:valine--tRNA ligase [Candidatus Thermoplasmatota archaeon]